MKKINTLQSLRFIAFLMIFLLHTQVYNFTRSFLKLNLGVNAAWGVSFFIILSGFLSGYKYCNYHGNYKYSDIKNFTIRKIKNFYPLHLAMLIFTIPLTSIFILISNKNFSGIITWFKGLIINILLLQGCFNKDYFNFNGVSWFLSLMIFLSIITIPLICIISKIGNTSKGIIKLFFCMLVIIIIDYIYVLYAKNNSLKMEYWLYVFPPSRIPEYVYGLIIGFIIGKKKDTISIKNYTLLELFSIVCVIIVMKYFAVYEWQWRSFSWIIPNTLLIAIFSFEKGKVSKLLSNKLLVWLGNITFEAFLIHQVISKYFRLVVGIKLSRSAQFGAEIYIFLLTIVISGFIHLITKNNFEIISKNINKIREA